MPIASHRSLNILAALVWMIGGILLLIKAGSLLIHAEALKPAEAWPWLAAVAGLFVGGLRATSLFSRSCRKNLERIAALDRPRIWQFFRPGFFVALGVMVGSGMTLSRLAHDNYSFLIGMGFLNLGIAVALLGSSHVFWKQKAFVK
ncbi:MAG: hypothetical protein V1800_01580 [Candidatus Latescibacterota bacterium]